MKTDGPTNGQTDEQIKLWRFIRLWRVSSPAPRRGLTRATSTRWRIASARICVDERLPAAEINTATASIVGAIDAELGAVKGQLEKQKNEEEKRRLKKIQEEMEAERRRKEEEEEKRRREEEEKRQRAEMEARRRAEEEEGKRKEAGERREQEEEDRKTAERLQAKLLADREEEEEEARQRREQEQQDHELALRLATENNGKVESPSSSLTSLSASLRRSETVVAERQTNLLKKHDLSKWKYADLRDTINTSCDVELLKACREEFHRRLKVYHQWKTTNKRHHVTEEAEARADARNDVAGSGGDSGSGGGGSGGNRLIRSLTVN